MASNRYQPENPADIVRRLRGGADKGGRGADARHFLEGIPNAWILAAGILGYDLIKNRGRR